MPPYDARGEENRAKRHRAVLVGVERYTGNRNDLPAVATNLRLMREALTAEGTGVLDPEDLVVVAGERGPAGGAPGGVDPLRVRAALSAARDEVTGLLVVYFAGHGIVRPDGSDLNLMFTDSRVSRDRHHPFRDTLSWRDDVMPELRNARAEWVVVVLDCCFAGNALSAFTPAAGQNFALLTAAERGVEIPPGDPAGGTEFTAALHRLLTAGTHGREPTTFTGVVAGIREEMAPLKAIDGHPWIPDELRHGDDVVLALPHGDDVVVAPPQGDDVVAALPHDRQPALPSPRPHSESTQPSPSPSPRPRPDATPGPAPAPAPGPLRRRPTRAMTLVLAGVLALAGAGAWMLLGPGPDGKCAPPLELRVLTDPDIRPTVQKAADAYPKQERHGDRDCRTVNLTVYDAKATDAVAAFRSSSLWQDPPAACPPPGDCPRPQRDVGAQPDIWIPAAGSTWRRATAEEEGGGSTAASAPAGATGADEHADAGDSAVTLEPMGSVAFTPMVLAVPYTMPLAPSLQTGAPLGTIISSLKAAQKQPIAVLRPDPEGTDGALLATRALYASSGSGPASTLEHVMAQELRPMPSTARELMCALADGSRNGLEDRAAVLVPEQTLAQFNLSAGNAARPSCATESLERRTAQYPSDVPVLDLPFLRVTWKDARRDAEARRDAVTRFHDWLATDRDAQRFFVDDGFRGVDGKGRPAPPAENSLLRTGVNESAVREDIPAAGPGTVTAATLGDVLRRYRSALGPGRVLYLLDNSTSMADKRVWDGPGRAKELVTRSMGSLGTKDEYGLWSMAVEEGRKATDLVPFGRNTRAVASEAAASATTADHDARIAEALHDAFTTLRGGTTDADQPRLLVLVTDDEDTADIGRKERDGLLTEAKGNPLVRIVSVSLQSGGCAPGRFGERLATATGGRCLDPADDIATELAAEVAKTGTGDAE
ncbi:caspase family protein [Streptomyces sp. NPDC005899]|uniref:caspase family protein n=1 Tax=Streptomyces sp. NPDC005899 TaxID=3155716 RepID=UPI0034045864